MAQFNDVTVCAVIFKADPPFKQENYFEFKV